MVPIRKEGFAYNNVQGFFSVEKTQIEDRVLVKVFRGHSRNSEIKRFIIIKRDLFTVVDASSCPAVHYNERTYTDALLRIKRISIDILVSQRRK